MRSFLFHSLLGSLNKIPISIAGILLFRVPISVPNLFSIIFGNISSSMKTSWYLSWLLNYLIVMLNYWAGQFAGIFFAKAKMS